MASVLSFLGPLGALVGGAVGQTALESNLTTFMYPDSSVTAQSAFVVNGSRVAPKGAEILTVGVIGGLSVFRYHPETTFSRVDGCVQTMAGRVGSLRRTTSASMSCRAWRRWALQFQMRSGTIVIRVTSNTSRMRLSCRVSSTADLRMGTRLILGSGHVGVCWADLRDEELQCFCNSPPTSTSFREEFADNHMRSLSGTTSTTLASTSPPRASFASRKRGSTCTAKASSNTLRGISALATMMLCLVKVASISRPRSLRSMTIAGTLWVL